MFDVNCVWDGLVEMQCIGFQIFLFCTTSLMHTKPGLNHSAYLSVLNGGLKFFDINYFLCTATWLRELITCSTIQMLLPTIINTTTSSQWSLKLLILISSYLTPPILLPSHPLLPSFPIATEYSSTTTLTAIRYMYLVHISVQCPIWSRCTMYHARWLKFWVYI